MKPIIVIKLGGSSLQNTETLKELSGLVRGYRKRRYNVVLVHGGGPAINQELILRGIKWQFIDGQRQTTPEMMGVIDDVLANQVNSHIVESLQVEGVQAVGMSGAADRILFCTQASAELMQVGKVESVDATSITEVLSHFRRQVPVIAPIGIDHASAKYNINADWAATQIAIALKAKTLIFLTDQEGILDERRERVRHATPALIDRMIASGVISGGMCTKVRAMTAALRGGVKKVRVLHASAGTEFLTNKKIGTLLSEIQPLTMSGVVHGYAC